MELCETTKHTGQPHLSKPNKPGSIMNFFCWTGQETGSWKIMLVLLLINGQKTNTEHTPKICQCFPPTLIIKLRYVRLDSLNGNMLCYQLLLSYAAGAGGVGYGVNYCALVKLSTCSLCCLEAH